MDIRWIAIAAALPLAACSSSEAPPESAPPPPEAEMTCQADAVQSYVGQAVTPDLGAAILTASGARTLRWGPPRSDRKRVGEGKSVSVRVDLGGRGYIKKKQHI